MTTAACGRILGPSAEHEARALELSSVGLVHVTGLPMEPDGAIIQAWPSEAGHFACHGGKAVLVTEDLEVWFGTCDESQYAMFTKYAPKQGARVPCSAVGSSINMHLLLARVADQYADCGGRFSPKPRGAIVVELRKTPLKELRKPAPQA